MEKVTQDTINGTSLNPIELTVFKVMSWLIPHEELTEPLIIDFITGIHTPVG